MGCWGVAFFFVASLLACSHLDPAAIFSARVEIFEFSVAVNVASWRKTVLQVANDDRRGHIAHSVDPEREEAYGKRPVPGRHAEHAAEIEEHGCSKEGDTPWDECT